MDKKIKKYRSIGQFFDKLTKLKANENIEYTGMFSLLQEPFSEDSGVPPFNLCCTPSANIEIKLTPDYSSSDFFDRYWIRWREKGAKPGNIMAFHIPIEKGSWEAQYQYDGENSRVRGKMTDSKLILDLKPELK